jgi:hypothetical protein
MIPKSGYRFSEKIMLQEEGNARGSAMCLLCEELWMPFELPPEAKGRTFVADSPETVSSEPALPPTPDTSPPRSAREEGNPEDGASSKNGRR